MRAPLAEHRERAIHAVERPPRRTDLRREEQVLLDREGGVDPAGIRGVAQACPRPLVRRQRRQIAPLERDPSFPVAMQPPETAERRAFSGPRAPREREELPPAPRR